MIGTSLMKENRTKDSPKRNNLPLHHLKSELDSDVYGQEGGPHQYFHPGLYSLCHGENISGIRKLCNLWSLV